MLGYLQVYFNNRVDDILSTDIQSNETLQVLADKYAIAYSQAAMAILSVELEPRPVQSAQIRYNIFVARVPKAPLFCLILFYVLYAALGLGLTFHALRAVHKDETVIDMQARLSVAGLTADCFEQDDVVGREVDASEDLFAERQGHVGVRIGVQRYSDMEGDGGSDGNEVRWRGWRFCRYDVGR